jgi:hypothetical protein
MLKCPDLCEPCYLDEEFAYLEANPHERQLRAIFAAARIDYGRIDYGVENGAVRVWEINTNPMITTPADAKIASRLRVQARFAPKFDRALKALADSEQSGARIVIPPRKPTRERRTLWRTIAAAISGRAA